MKTPGSSIRSGTPQSLFSSLHRVLIAAGVILFSILSAHALTYSPPADGLVSWWRGEGNGVDSAGGHNGDVGSSVTYVPGIAGQAFNFSEAGAANGTGRVNVPDNDAFKLTSSLTISAWVRTDVTAWVILQRGDYRAGLDPYTFSFNAYTGLLGFGIASDTDYASIEVPYLLPEQQWMHLAATLDGTTGDMRIYVNGIVAAETFTSVRPLADLDPSYNPSIGIGNSAAFHNFPFIGQIDEVLLYSRALSQTEIAALVPEPSSLALAGLALVAGVLYRRRK